MRRRSALLNLSHPTHPACSWNGAFPVGPSTVAIVVEAQDDDAEATYEVEVIRESPAGNEELVALSGTTSEGSSLVLTPAFSRLTTQYYAGVAFYVDSVSLSFQLADPLGSAALASGGSALAPVATAGSSGAVPLAAGSNDIAIAVTAADTISVQTYVVTVSRDAPPPPPSPPPPAPPPPPEPPGNPSFLPVVASDQVIANQVRA
jgi:hypothetical protein